MISANNLSGFSLNVKIASIALSAPGNQSSDNNDSEDNRNDFNSSNTIWSDWYLSVLPSVPN